MGNFDDRNAPYSKTVDVELTSAELLALYTTPVEVLPTLPSGQAYIILGVTAVKPAGTAYAGIDVSEDLTLKYTNGSGSVLASLETTGFLDQATKQVRHAFPSSWTTNAPSALLNVTPVESAKVVAHMSSGNITTGNTSLHLRIRYAIVPTDLDVSNYSVE